MKKYLLIVMLSAGVTGMFAFRSENVAVFQDNPDMMFVRNAAEGGMLEVRLGELAVKNGTTQKVKDYGNTMITDHTKVNEELMALVKKKKMQIPKKLSAAKQQKVDSLAAMQGEQFDMLYMNMMIASHEETIALFEKEGTGGNDAELKNWADSKLPALKHHLEMAQMLSNKN